MRKDVANAYMILLATVSLIIGIALREFKFFLSVLWAIYGLATENKKDKEIALGFGFSLLILLLLYFFKSRISYLF